MPDILKKISKWKHLENIIPEVCQDKATLHFLMCKELSELELATVL